MSSSQWTDLIKIDEKTPFLILGMIQYSTIYIILIFFVTSFIDSLFKYNEEKHHFNLLLEIVAQLLVNILAIYYIRKVSKLFPPLFAIESDVFFKDTQNIMFVTFILAALQPNLMNKIKGARTKFGFAENFDPSFPTSGGNRAPGNPSSKLNFTTSGQGIIPRGRDYDCHAMLNCHGKICNPGTDMQFIHDPTCRKGGLGCIGDTGCKYCGFGPFKDVPC